MRHPILIAAVVAWSFGAEAQEAKGPPGHLGDPLLTGMTSEISHTGFVNMGSVTVSDGVDEQALSAQLSGIVPAIQTCFQKRLEKKKAEIGGTMMINVSISAQGAVTAAAAAGIEDAATERCALASVRKVRLKPAPGKKGLASFALDFSTGLGNLGTSMMPPKQPQPGKVPRVDSGDANVTGALDKALIRRIVRMRMPQIKLCYEKALLKTPELEGRLTVQFVIDPEGVVQQANASGMVGEVSACVANVVKGLQFPKPKGGGLVNVTYPFVFKPAGS